MAKRLGKTPAWVSQRLALLELTPELQKKVDAGKLKVEPARRIGRLPKEKQADEAQRPSRSTKTPRQRRRQPTVEEVSDVATVNGVNTPESVRAPDSPGTAAANAVNTSEAQEPETQPQEEGGQPRRLPYDNPFSVVTHLHLKMEPAAFAEGARVWLRILREQHPDAYSAVVQELSQQEQPA